VIPGKETKKLKAVADKAISRSDRSAYRILKYPVKKTGLYRLQRVVDETKLDVRRILTDTVVVRCPKASTKPTSVNRCKGELSDLEIEVIGTPPLKIKYSRAVNSKEKGFSFQSILPDGLVSPLIGQGNSLELVSRASPDLSWALSQRVTVPINESLNTAGEWLYSIDEVHDGFGNVINYSRLGDDGDRSNAGSAQLEQHYTIYERPLVALTGHDEERPVKLAKGKSTRMPLHLSAYQGKTQLTYTLSYLFTPTEKLLSNGEHAADAKLEEVTIRGRSPDVGINQPGLYTLQGISTQFCRGQINEPSSFQLINPPEPEISLSSENIFDNCAGNAIGLLVDVDLIGTPPFHVRYEVSKKGTREIHRRIAQIDNLRHQLELRPREAGHYVYTFKSIDDEVYKGHTLHGSQFVLEQDVKPPASARFAGMSASKQACIEEPVSFDIRLQGEGPWNLDYEIVHGGKRTKHKVSDIQQEEYTLTTDKLIHGGEYALALASVQDQSGCKIFLKEEAQIDVRRQRPKASFGLVEGSRVVKTLEGHKVSLPLKLSGEGPWTVWYRKSDQSPPAEAQHVEVEQSNGFLVVDSDGSYELLDVLDSSCPGTVDSKANKFSVAWIPRPQVKMSESAAVEQSGEDWTKKDICEGDEDAVEVKLTGMSPWPSVIQCQNTDR
jgi:nucleoporin POM152